MDLLQLLYVVEARGGDASVPTPLSLGVDVSHPSPLELACHSLEIVWCVSFPKKKTYGESGGFSHGRLAQLEVQQNVNL